MVLAIVNSLVITLVNIFIGTLFSHLYLLTPKCTRSQKEELIVKLHPVRSCCTHTRSCPSAKLKCSLHVRKVGVDTHTHTHTHTQTNHAQTTGTLHTPSPQNTLRFLKHTEILGLFLTSYLWGGECTHSSSSTNQDLSTVFVIVAEARSRVPACE